MIARIIGNIIEKSATEVVVNCNGVGYVLGVPVSSSDLLGEVGSSVDLYTILQVREDALTLFGFKTTQERDLFVLLTNISGIGGKTALAILSSISVGELRDAILANNLAMLKKLPGIGPKTAERLLLELRDKILSVGISTSLPNSSPTLSLIQQDAISGLIALGYNKVVAEKSVREALKASKSMQWTADELIRASLKFAIS